MEWIDSKRLIFKKLIYWSIMLFLYMSLDSCIKPYLAPQSVANLGYLVVDGTIVKDTVTTIKLSRTRNVDDTGKVVPETNAQLFIEGKSGDLFTFQSIQDGVYTSNTEALQTDNEYRLRIIAADGKEYMSDFVTVRITPDIDSVEWLQEDDIFIKVNTHDPSNKTIYYRWEYFETIEYRVPYESYMIIEMGKLFLLNQMNIARYVTLISIHLISCLGVLHPYLKI